MITLLTGENTFRIKESADRLVADARERLGDDGVRRVDGSELTPSDLPQLLSGGNLFAPQQLVLLSHASKNKPLWEALDAHIDTLDDSVTLVLVDPSPDKRTKTYKHLQKKADVRVHDALNDRQLEEWIQTHVRAQEGNIERETARFLVQHAGMDQWRLYQELTKLLTIGTTITTDDIRHIVEPELQANAFDVLDACLAGQMTRVISQLHILRAAEDPYRFFGLLTSQIHILAVCVSATGQAPDQIAKSFGAHPFVVKKTLSLARQLSKERVGHMIDIVAETDMQMKTSGGEPWLLIELCLGEIAAQQKTR